MKKILGLSIAAFLVLGLVGGGTWAYFSDTETSSTNILSAGTLDLKLNSGDADVTTITASVSDVKPGDSNSGSVTLQAGGTLAGELDITLSAITNTQGSGGTEYEASGSGELGANAYISIYIDVDQSGTWNTGDLELENDETIVPYDTDSTLDGGTIDSFDSDSWDDIYSGTFTGPDDFRIEWNIPTGVGNSIQGDSASFDISFVLEQAAAD